MPLTFTDYETKEKYEVKALTGPVSLHILNPREDFLTRNPYAPIFILFGDAHFSTNNYCGILNRDREYKKTANYYDENDGENDIHQANFKVYRVFNKHFLKLLSNVVDVYEDNDNVVDFYIEGGEFHRKSISTNEEFPMHKFWRWFSKCYYNRRMEQTDKQKSNENFCIKYAKNIRWQSGDIRFFAKTKMNRNLGEFLIDFMIKFSTNYFGNETEDNFQIFCNEEILKYPRDTWWRIDLEKVKINPSEIFNQYVHKRGSLIRKQLAKITNKDLRTGLESRFNDYVKDIDRKILDENNKDFFIKTFNDFQDLLKSEYYSIDSQVNIGAIWELYKSKELPRFVTLLIKLNSSLADLYMIARCYKIMNNLASNPDSHTEKPLINACYFGTFHMENIKDFLTKGASNGDYNLIVDINDDTNITDTHDKNRCLKIEKNLDMDGLINRLITRREEHEKKLSIKAKKNKYKELAKIRAES